jgi:hypothetical protein
MPGENEAVLDEEALKQVLESEQASDNTLSADDEMLDDAPDGEGEDAEPEEIELDFAGNKRKFAKNMTIGEIAADLEEYTKGLWSGHTKRSQELAEQAKALEAEMTAAQKLRGMSGELLDKFAQGRQIAAEMQRIGAIDVSQLWQSNADQARRVSDHMAQLRTQFSQIVQEVSDEEARIAQEESAAFQRRIESGRAAVLKAIPSFEKDFPEVKKYAVEHGISPEDAENWAENQFAAMAVYKAWKYDSLMRRAASAAKGAPAQPVRAMPTSGAASPARIDLVKDADRMTADEWVKRRRAQRERQTGPQRR